MNDSSILITAECGRRIDCVMEDMSKKGLDRDFAAASSDKAIVLSETCLWSATTFTSRQHETRSRAKSSSQHSSSSRVKFHCQGNRAQSCSRLHNI